MNAPLVHPLRTESSALSSLVAAEGALLAATSRVELRHVAVAEAAKLLSAPLAAWVRRRGRKLLPRAVSAVGKTDRSSLFGQWLERSLRPHATATEPATFQPADNPTPFPHLLFAPHDTGGLVVLLPEAPTETDRLKLARLAKLAGACDRARRSAPKRGGQKVWPFVTLALGAALCIPVPLSTLAPAEVVGADAVRVTAPFDAVVERVHVEPHAHVEAGTPLVTLEATEYRNTASVAEREERLARARARRSALHAFSDPAAKADIAVAEAEAELARARKDHALADLARTELSAEVAGLAIFASEDWRGRPVATGEALLEIADPSRVELRLHVPLSSGEPLEPGAKVRLFLDHDPSEALEGELLRAAFLATPQPDGGMAFEARASVRGTPRIGARGVAKIYGGTAPLGWWIVRRPVTSLRQTVGL